MNKDLVVGSSTSVDRFQMVYEMPVQGCHRITCFSTAAEKDLTVWDSSLFLPLDFTRVVA